MHRHQEAQHRKRTYSANYPNVVLQSENFICKCAICICFDHWLRVTMFTRFRIYLNTYQHCTGYQLKNFLKCTIPRNQKDDDIMLRFRHPRSLVIVMQATNRVVGLQNTEQVFPQKTLLTEFSRLTDSCQGIGCKTEGPKTFIPRTHEHWTFDHCVH